MKRRTFVTLLASLAWRQGVISLLTGVQDAAWAQGSKPLRRIAIVSPLIDTRVISPTGTLPWRAFFAELHQLGISEGENLIVQRSSARGSPGELDTLLDAVLLSKPDIIFVISTRVALIAGKKTHSIPIVCVASDPVALGLVTSLARPGGNVTGVIPDGGIQVLGKQIDLLLAIRPTTSRVGFLVPRTSLDLFGPYLTEYASRVGREVFPLVLEGQVDDSEYRRVFGRLSDDRPDALVVSNSPENFATSALIVELANTSRLPTIYPDSSFVRVGGLISYGADLPELLRTAAASVAKIFQGTPAGEIPFHQATHFELALNKKTADLLEVDVSPSLLAQSDTIIE